MFNNAFNNRRILVTGHTGFKGSWLTLWLKRLGANVAAISLPPETFPSHWELLKLDIESYYVDIRDETSLRNKIKAINPEIIFHLAAQPLVRRSYKNPIYNWATNVMGTVNLLDSCRELNKLAAIVVVTTDKCYENKEWVWGYRENDVLGGHDPYSASKAAVELVTASYRQAFFYSDTSPLLATVRAGNVIGGGDWSEDRLIPDIVRSIQNGVPLEIRSPNATRPWQHVLECISGYLLLGQHLLAGNKSCAEAWNFGPDREGNHQVIEVLMELKQNWPNINWETTNSEQPHEAQLLYLDSDKARKKLAWKPVWSFSEGVKVTAEWYREWIEQNIVISESQLENYIHCASQHGLIWAMEHIK